ncbi:MAG: NAD(P)H-binding protein, partial [bacterium]|nr:NAD(P)H-binding protein [bacterium]
MESSAKRLILVTGATGYVGGRLIRPLEARGERVRCMARRPEVLKDRVGADTEVVFGDLASPDTLGPAFEGVHTAYYLVHSLGTMGDFVEQELRNAEHFAEAAKAAGVRRIVYLGGLCDETADLSSHLRSRLKVGEILRASGIQTIEFRASIVIGSGSLSFELIRTLVRRLPVMITPRWVRTMAQPIAIPDVLAYLGAALDLDRGDHAIYEIGGEQQMSYAGL